MGFLMDVFVASFAVIRPERDDDGTDRLHYFVTANLLIGLSVLTGYKIFNGRAVRCMMPDLGFREIWMTYVDNYCWAQGTYFIPNDKREPPSPRELEIRGRHVGYYQWIPLFLIFEALCFCLPRMFWNSSCQGSGIRISDIVDLSRDKSNFKPEIRNNTINTLSTHLKNALSFHTRIERRNLYKWFSPGSLKYTACYVTIMYLITKVLFFVNAFMQFKIMNWFLFNNTSGLGHVKSVIGRKTWNDTGYFPRVSYCIITTRGIASTVQNHTVQCVLTINLFNEKIFLFLWFWYLFLMGLTALSTVYWAAVLLVPGFSKRFMIRHLKLADQPFSVRKNQYHVNKFVKQYLRQDGVLVLRMFSLHTGVIFATQLVLRLWNDYFGFQPSLEAVANRKAQPGEKSETDDKDVPDAVKKKEKDENLDDDLLNMDVVDQKIVKMGELIPVPSPTAAKRRADSDDDSDEDDEAGGDEEHEKHKQPRAVHQAKVDAMHVAHGKQKKR